MKVLKARREGKLEARREELEGQVWGADKRISFMKSRQLFVTKIKKVFYFPHVLLYTLYTYTRHYKWDKQDKQNQIPSYFHILVWHCTLCKHLEEEKSLEAEILDTLGKLSLKIKLNAKEKQNNEHGNFQLFANCNQKLFYYVQTL